MVTTKQVVEITETDVGFGDVKGLSTKLFFDEGVTTQEGTFNSISIFTNSNIKSGEDIFCETMAFGNGKSIYCVRAKTEEKKFQEHFAAINFFKDKYLNS